MPAEQKLYRLFGQESRPNNWVTNANAEHLTALPDGRGYLQHHPKIGVKMEHRDVKLGVPQPGSSVQRVAGASREYLENNGYVGLYKLDHE